MSRSQRNKLVALAGNPNTGKTTLFNVLTHSRARVGNYPGVTVDRSVGKTTLPRIGTVDVLDVPGTYSLVARTGEEQIAIEAMLGLVGQPRPDLVVVCVDSTQVIRGLYLVLQAMELGLPVIVALTMTDEAGDAAPNSAALARTLGCPAVAVVARRRHGIETLLEAIAVQLEGASPEPQWQWQPTKALSEKLATVRAVLPDDWPRNDAMALWALMSIGAKDDGQDELAGIPDSLRAATVLDDKDARDVDDEAICARYGWLDRKIAPLIERPPDRSRTERVDRILIHPVAGLAIFLGLMFLVFQALFAGADPLIRLIETGISFVGVHARDALPPGLFADFLVDGLIGGVGSVVVFLPQILMLFFFLGFLEDSGYMARVAYLVDRMMRNMNLHGRAFVPMLSGFACAVPAIMATRTMERKRDRLLTMMVVPLTTCSARLPIYTLIIASLFPARKVLGLFPVQGLMMVGMYVFGIVTALIVAWVLSRAIKPLRGRRLPFVIELPPYRLPRLADVVEMMWSKAKYFLNDAGRIIVVCSMVLWVLLSFPRGQQAPALETHVTEGDVAAATHESDPEAQRAAQRLQHSYAGRLGHTLEPLLQPLGFDWKIGVGIIGAFAAREVFVATMGVVYGIGDSADEESQPLRDKIRSERHADGSTVYTPLVGFTLMIFFALACQCMSTLAVIRRETGSLRWPAFVFIYMTGLAWVVSFAVYQGGRLLGLG